MCILIHFVLYPLSRPIITNSLQYTGPREFVLILYPMTSLARPWSLSTTPFLLVFLALLVCLPTVPFPGDTTFTILLLALAFHLWQLHSSCTPSPIFLFPVEKGLPLRTFLGQSTSRILFPALMFFLPVLLLTAFLLSISLADTFLQVIYLHFSSLGPAPMETRSALLTLFGVETLLLAISLSILALSFSSRALPPDRPADAWDHYSTPVGLDARRSFARAVAAYPTPYTFPPPFSIIRLLLIQVPSVVFHLIGLDSLYPYLETVERILWRITVGPVALVVAGLWLWGLRQPRLRHM